MRLVDSISGKEYNPPIARTGAPWSTSLRARPETPEAVATFV